MDGYIPAGVWALAHIEHVAILTGGGWSGVLSDIPILLRRSSGDGGWWMGARVREARRLRARRQRCAVCAAYWRVLGDLRAEYVVVCAAPMMMDVPHAGGGVCQSPRAGLSSGVGWRWVIYDRGQGTGDDRQRRCQDCASRWLSGESRCRAGAKILVVCGEPGRRGGGPAHAVGGARRESQWTAGVGFEQREGLRWRWSRWAGRAGGDVGERRSTCAAVCSGCVNAGLLAMSRVRCSGAADDPEEQPAQPIVAAHVICYAAAHILDGGRGSVEVELLRRDLA
ncbi:hypothetical protein B0H13DRAFT_1881903 [Mycena leptocephala]|nr:hypothetical protein B0H13DRAFT_1881903 [Mycena leptocephala]